MKLRIGRRAIEVSDFAEASRVYRDECDAHCLNGGRGSSDMPNGILPGHYVSWNGKVWPGQPREWTPAAVPVFVP
jgi:hypothetical protein